MSNAQRPPQRPLNSAYDGRTGAPKSTQETIAPAHGMRSRSGAGARSPLGTPEHAGGQPLADAENFSTRDKLTTPLLPHLGTPSRGYDQRGKFKPDEASAVLRDAANLGKGSGSKA